MRSRSCCKKPVASPRGGGIFFGSALALKVVSAASTKRALLHKHHHTPSTQAHSTDTHGKGTHSRYTGTQHEHGGLWRVCFPPCLVRPGMINSKP